jgi:hypothetical protein
MAIYKLNNLLQKLLQSPPKFVSTIFVKYLVYFGDIFHRLKAAERFTFVGWRWEFLSWVFLALFLISAAYVLLTLLGLISTLQSTQCIINEMDNQRNG